MSEVRQSPPWPERLQREFVKFGKIFVYLAVFFCVFAWYGRLVRADAHLATDDLWVPLIEAAVLAKVILLLDLCRFGSRLEHRPLIVPTLYRAAAFGVGIAVFGLLEHTVRGLIQGHGMLYGVQTLTRTDWHELLARTLVKLVALLPLVAIGELDRALGPGALGRLFLKDSHLGRNLATPLEVKRSGVESGSRE